MIDNQHTHKVIEAIRTINALHNLGDAIYDVRERHGGDDGFTGNSWEHPKVIAYGEAVATLAREIGFPVPTAASQALPCPFCGEAPVTEEDEANKEFSIICARSTCLVQPSVTTDSESEALERWNRRES